MRVAAYARYSTEMQREASLDDQLRNCRAYCARQGWPDPVAYTDAAMSGARGDRPGYRSLLAEARRYDVVLVDDLSRLSRDSAECTSAVKRLTFAGVRLVGVSDGVDTARKSHKADVGLRSLMSELYLEDLADKTHRGLTGRALAGASAGGLPYGYRVATTADGSAAIGERMIDEAQAAIVRRIFDDYIAGASSRTIAAALNRERVPSARGSTWAVSAIYGDIRRGIGILANPIYIGRQVWNRSRWIKHPDSGRRVRQERPASEWITTEHPELAIVTRDAWEAAQARLRGKAQRAPITGEGGRGRPPRHLLSGILRCSACGGPIVIVDYYRYGCARNKDRGESACPSSLRVARELVERALLAGVQRELLSDAAFERFLKATREALRRSAPDVDVAKARVTAAERAHGNMMAAIRAGVLTPSTRTELLATEAELDAARRALQAVQAERPAQILPRARETWRTIVASIGERARNVPAARSALRELLGPNVVLRKENGAIYAEIAPSEICMVAGARSVLYLTDPIRIPITP
jgi:site-specific DNA recombinase